MASKAERKRKRRKAREDALIAENWLPRPERGKDRPTPQRRSQGAWALLDTDDAGSRVAKDFAAHPIDELEHRGIITNDEASAGRDFEALVLAATEIPATRDSCTIWEPKGFSSDDGNVLAVRDRKELYLCLGTLRDQLLRRVCVEHHYPHPRELEPLREALRECVAFFKT